MVLAIVAALGWLILVAPGLFAASPSIFRWVPGMVSLALRRQAPSDLLTVGPAAAVLGLTMAASFAVGFHLVGRSDVTD